MAKQGAICAYCGAAEKVLTDDHVIPQAMWGGRGHLPAHVITVPACGCHKPWDDQVEYFRNVLTIMIDRGSHPVANRLLEGPVTRSLERNPRSAWALTRNMRLAPRMLGAILSGYSWGFDVDVPRFQAVPNKIVRGLFFHKSGTPLAGSHDVEVFRGNGFWQDEGFQNVLSTMEPAAGCGDNVFLCRATRDSADPNCTAWLLQFYGQIAIFAWTKLANAQP